MVGMDSLIAVDGCFSSNHAALRGKSKELLAWNQDNMSEWRDKSIRRLFFLCASTINNSKPATLCSYPLMLHG
jgi:hypothetical protein